MGRRSSILQFSDHFFDGRDDGARAHQVDRVSISGERCRSGPGPATPAVAQRRRRPRSPAPASSGGRAVETPQVQRPGRGEDLDREHPGQAVDGPAQLARRRPAHRHVVLLHRRGGDGVDARRAREPLQLRDDRGLGVLRDHVPAVDPGVVGEERRQAVAARLVEEPVGTPLADRRDVGGDDRGEVEHVGHRGAVEVAVGLDPVLLRQHHRVVDRRRQLPPGDRGAVREGVPRGAVHLRRAAQRVGVLDPVAVRPAVRGDHPAVGQDRHQVGRGVGLARVRPERLELGAKTRSVPSWASTDIAAATSAVRSSTSRSRSASTSIPSIPSVPLIRASPSLAASSTGLETRGGQRLGGRHQRAVGVADLTLPDQGERAVRERREVAGAAERAVLVHHRRDPVGEQVGDQLRGLRPDAGVPGRERGEPQQHQRADHLALHLGAGAGGVRADQRALQLRAHLGRDVPGGEGAEPGGDPVRRGLGARRAPRRPPWPARSRHGRAGRARPRRRAAPPPPRRRRRPDRCRRRPRLSHDCSSAHPSPPPGAEPANAIRTRLTSETARRRRGAARRSSPHGPRDRRPCGARTALAWPHARRRPCHRRARAGVGRCSAPACWPRRPRR